MGLWLDYQFESIYFREYVQVSQHVARTPLHAMFACSVLS